MAERSTEEGMGEIVTWVMDRHMTPVYVAQGHYIHVHMHARRAKLDRILTRRDGRKHMHACERAHAFAHTPPLSKAHMKLGARALHKRLRVTCSPPHLQTSQSP
jgi:hypothetical protein